jgi:hypothetical protein
MFVTKSNVVLKSILRTAMGISTQHNLPTDLSIVKGETMRLLITVPTGVVNKIKELEGACWYRPRGHGLVSPGLLEEDVRYPPTSSWWALKTPLTLARRGSCRRPSGGRGG